MKFSENNLKQLVESCQGNSSLVDGYIKKLKENEPETLTELADYPFREHYSWLLDEKEAPLFRKRFIEDEYWDKCSVITLENVLERLADDAYGDDFDTKDLTDAEIVELHFSEMAKELVKLCFGSMEYDW